MGVIFSLLYMSIGRVICWVSVFVIWGFLLYCSNIRACLKTAISDDWHFSAHNFTPVDSGRFWVSENQKRPLLNQNEVTYIFHFSVYVFLSWNQDDDKCYFAIGQQRINNDRYFWNLHSVGFRWQYKSSNVCSWYLFQSSHPCNGLTVQRTLRRNRKLNIRPEARPSCSPDDFLYMEADDMIGVT